MTSPPYANAQDYFRNFKLELHVLDNLFQCNIQDIMHRFVGTERGRLLDGIHPTELTRFKQRFPVLCAIEAKSFRGAAIVCRYLSDMRKAVTEISSALKPKGKAIVVCGDNLICGVRLKTWKLLNTMFEESGFSIAEKYSDKIRSRSIPPNRMGHKSIIKHEVVSLLEKRG